MGFRVYLLEVMKTIWVHLLQSTHSRWQYNKTEILYIYHGCAAPAVLEDTSRTRTHSYMLQRLSLPSMNVTPSSPRDARLYAKQAEVQICISRNLLSAISPYRGP